MATATTADRIGDLLVREGIITSDQLAKALEDARQNKTRVGYALIRLGLVEEETLTRALARQLHVPAVDLNRVVIDPKLLKLVPSDMAQKHQVLPLRRVGRMLTVAMANPTNQGAMDDLRFSTRHDIEPVIAGEALCGLVIAGVWQGETPAVYRFGKVVIGAKLHRFNGLFGSGKSGDEQYSDFGGNHFDFLEERQTVQPRHAHIGNDEVIAGGIEHS